MTTQKALNYCPVGGLLIGTQGWLPETPYEYNWGTFDPRIGCNQLRCENCGEKVRHLANVLVTDNNLVKAAELYATQDWLSLAYVKPENDLKGRLYACRCNWRLQFGSTELEPPIDQAEREFDSKWHCAGHPFFTLPNDFLGVHLDKNTDIETVVRALLVPTANLVPPQTAHVSGYTLMRLYIVLKNVNLLGGRVSKAVATCLGDPDPLVRRAALEFFYEFPQAPGAEQISKALQQQRALFNGQTDPTDSRYELDEHLLRVLDNRLATLKDLATVKLVRQEIMQGTRRPALIQTLAPLDLGWVRDNAGDIVQANPTILKKLLYALKEFADDEIVAALRLVRGRGLLADSEIQDTLRQVFSSNPERGDKIIQRIC